MRGLRVHQCKDEGPGLCPDPFADNAIARIIFSLQA
jgi:hypothetical protein